MRTIGFLVIAGALVFGAAWYMGMIDGDVNVKLTSHGQDLIDEQVDRAKTAAEEAMDSAKAKVIAKRDEFMARRDNK